MTVLAGAIGNYCRFSVLRNKLTNGPMVNYDLLNMNIPMVTCGSILGVLMNNVLPECIICTILIGILMISFGKTHKR